MFKKMLIIPSLLMCMGLVGTVSAQDSVQKTKDLVAALDKTKYKKKEKKNISVEVFVDIKNEAVTKADPTEYSGQYVSDGYQLSLTVGKDGTVNGSGFDTFLDGDKTVSFELKDARVAGALLTGVKVYENGSRDVFEAVFINRTSRTGTNPTSINESSIKFGIGFIQKSRGSGIEPEFTNRVFLERK